jgi:hypothetical protein
VTEQQESDRSHWRAVAARRGSLAAVWMGRSKASAPEHAAANARLAASAAFRARPDLRPEPR